MRSLEVATTEDCKAGFLTSSSSGSLSWRDSLRVRRSPPSLLTAPSRSLCLAGGPPPLSENPRLSNKLPRPLPPPGPERASNLAWMGRGPGSAAAPGTGLDVPAFWELVALPTSHSPRLDGCLWSRHFPSGLYLTSFGSRPYHKGAKPFPAGRNSGIIELAECRGRGNRKLLFSPPAQRTDRVSVGSVWFPQLSDFLVRPEGLVALGWTCPGTGLTPVPAFRKRSDFHGLLATKDGAAD